MQQDTARALGNLTIALLGAVAAYYVATHPTLRRFAWRALKYTLTTEVPRYVWEETRRAWVDSGSPRPTPATIMPM